jgi:hypothetical protein
MGFWIMGLTDLPIGIGARSVEVAKRDRSQAARRVEVGQHAFDGQFGIPVWINGTLWMVFGNGIVSGAPYVAHVDEKTTGMVSKLRTVRSSADDAATLLRRCSEIARSRTAIFLPNWGRNFAAQIRWGSIATTSHPTPKKIFTNLNIQGRFSAQDNVNKTVFAVKGRWLQTRLRLRGLARMLLWNISLRMVDARSRFFFAYENGGHAGIFDAHKKPQT